MIDNELKGFVCGLCNYFWHPKKFVDVDNLPKCCPKCKSYDWNKEKFTIVKDKVKKK